MINLGSLIVVKEFINHSANPIFTGVFEGEIDIIKEIVKRNGKVVPFQQRKITEAIFKAMTSVGNGNLDDAEKISRSSVFKLEALTNRPTVEQVQDVVIDSLMNDSIDGRTFTDVAESYILYRENRKKIREEKQRIESDVQLKVMQKQKYKLEDEPPIELRLRPSTVTNRQGQRVPIDVTKIRRVIEKACIGLEGVDPIDLELDSQLHFYEGISTRQIQETLIKVANEKTSTKQPNWTYVAARLLLHDLYQDAGRSRDYAGSDYGDFYNLVKKLAEIGRYDLRMLESFSEEEIKILGAYIKPERDLLFTYPGLKHLSDRYAVRGFDNEVMELPQEVFMGIAMYLSLAEKKDERLNWAKKFYDVLSNLFITMATPTFANARRPKAQLSSCFIDTIEDSLQGIFDGLTTFAKVSQNGGGMGVYLGKLRSLGSTIRGYKGAGSGIVPWIRLYNDTAVSVNQLGQRAGAVSIWLDIWHNDIIDFLDLKTNNGDERRKAHDIFPGVCIPDLFYRTMEKNGTWYLFDPNEIRIKKGWSLEDYWGEEFEKKYLECVNDPQIDRKEMPSLDIMGLILKSLYETGGPFIFNRDTVNRMNPNKHAGMIYSSNLCTEICQNQSPTIKIRDELENDTIRQEYRSGDLVVCNLSSINLGRTDTIEKLKEVIPVQVRMLDDVITMNNLPLEQALRTNMRYRAIGIGISGYHQHLVKKGIMWESEEHLSYMDKLFEEINYIAIRSSMELSKEKGSYPLFKGSDWDTGEYFRLRGYNSDRWMKLADEIHKNGIRNGYLMAIAPTGSTSVIAGSTAGIDPVFKPVFTEEKKGFLIRQVAPELTADNLILYKGAHQINQEWSIRAGAVRQKHIDQSQSMNLYATPEMDEQKFLELYHKAWKLGIKTIYYFRNFTIEEDSSEIACESCQA